MLQSCVLLMLPVTARHGAHPFSSETPNPLPFRKEATEPGFEACSLSPAPRLFCLSQTFLPGVYSQRVGS